MISERAEVVKLRFSNDDRIHKVSKIMEIPKDEIVESFIPLDLR